MRSTPAHTCPQFEKAPQGAPSTARARSASASTSIGSLPPSSSVTGRSSSAHAIAIRRPTSVEPVKKTFASPGARTSAPPTSPPAPCTVWTSPAGAPASTNARSTHAPESGVSSEGFTTTAFPAATAATVWVNGIASGKFQGESTADADMTPILALDQSRAPVQVDELGRDPGAEVVLADVGANRLQPRVPLLRGELQRGVDRLRLARDVERVHRERPLAELLVHTRVLGEDEHAVALVHERRLLGDEVEAVVDRVHEQHVELLVGRDRLREVVADLEVDRRPPVLLEAVVHDARGALDRAQILGVLGDVLAGRVEEGQHRHPPVHLRVLVEVELEGAEATDDVLRRVGAVDAQDEELRPALGDLALGGEHGRARRELLELVRVDRDRVRSDEDPPAPVLGALEVGLEGRAEDVEAAAEEIPPPAARVEADDVVREHAVVDRAPDGLGEHVPVVRLRPRDVHEVRERRVRRLVADHARREVEVVVVEEDGRLGLALELGEHRIREPAVDGHVAALPGVV